MNINSLPAIQLFWMIIIYRLDRRHKTLEQNQCTMHKPTNNYQSFKIYVECMKNNDIFHFFFFFTFFPYKTIIPSKWSVESRWANKKKGKFKLTFMLLAGRFQLKHSNNINGRQPFNRLFTMVRDTESLYLYIFALFVFFIEAIKIIC